MKRHLFLRNWFNLDKDLAISKRFSVIWSCFSHYFALFVQLALTDVLTIVDGVFFNHFLLEPHSKENQLEMLMDWTVHKRSELVSVGTSTTAKLEIAKQNVMTKRKKHIHTIPHHIAMNFLCLCVKHEKSTWHDCNLNHWDWYQIMLICEKSVSDENDSDPLWALSFVWLSFDVFTLSFLFHGNSFHLSIILRTNKQPVSQRFVSMLTNDRLLIFPFYSKNGASMLFACFFFCSVAEAQINFIFFVSLLETHEIGQNYKQTQNYMKHWYFVVFFPHHSYNMPSLIIL